MFNVVHLLYSTVWSCRSRSGGGGGVGGGWGGVHIMCMKIKITHCMCIHAGSKNAYRVSVG